MGAHPARPHLDRGDHCSVGNSASESTDWGPLMIPRARPWRDARRTAPGALARLSARHHPSPQAPIPRSRPRRAGPPRSAPGRDLGTHPHRPAGRVRRPARSEPACPGTPAPPAATPPGRAVTPATPGRPTRYNSGGVRSSGPSAKGSALGIDRLQARSWLPSGRRRRSPAMIVLCRSAVDPESQASRISRHRLQHPRRSADVRFELCHARIWTLWM